MDGRYRTGPAPALERSPGRGELLKPFEGMGRGTEWYVAAFQGCAYRCTYCYLRSYLGSLRPVLWDGPARWRSRIRAFLASPEARGARVHLAHLGDVLPFERETGLARELAPLFPGPGGATLEIRTKSDALDALLRLPPQPGVLLSWTLTPEPFARRFEKGAPSTGRRLRALRRAADAGWRVGLRFDPWLTPGGWEQAYGALLARVAGDRLPVEDVHLGVLRFPRAQRRALEASAEGRDLLAEELVRGPDGKTRMHAPRRVAVLRKAAALVRDELGPGIEPELCMEPAWVGRAVLERSAGSRGPEVPFSPALS